MSPFLVRLDKEFRLAKDDDARAEVEAKRAGYFARTGNFSKAKDVIAALRVVYADGHAVRITILIMIAEALVYHYETLNHVGLDRIIRAQFLSRMIKDSQLEAITSAWRAHIEFENSKFPEMFVSLEAAHNRALFCDCNEAFTRVANIACKIALLCGETNFAKTQFLIGRDRALLDGDQASIEALQHNKAAFRLSRLRSNMCFGAVDPDDLRETRTEIATARSLQYLAHITALPTYIDLCQAHILMVEGRLLEAVDALNLIRNGGPFPVGTFSTELVDLELSFCLATLGRLNEAMEIFKNIDLTLIESLDADERLFVRWLELSLAELDNRFGISNLARIKFQESAVDYHLMIEVLSSGLKKIFFYVNEQS